MVLIRKYQKLAWYTPRLEHVERRQPLGYGQSIVQLAMYDLGIGPLALFGRRNHHRDTVLTSCGVCQFPTNRAGSHLS